MFIEYILNIWLNKKCVHKFEYKSLIMKISVHQIFKNKLKLTYFIMTHNCFNIYAVSNKINLMFKEYMNKFIYHNIFLNCIPKLVKCEVI